jgi:CheY-like chemotaxis protein
VIPAFDPPRRVLLADDDREVRLGMADLLADLGLLVEHAETGLEALEVVRACQVHAALLDLRMPGCSGLEALVRIHELRADLPCIVCSGSLTEHLEDSLLEAGAFAVLHKPVQPGLLRKEVLRALRVSPYLPRADQDLN